jgi:HEAT repeat protein
VDEFECVRAAAVAGIEKLGSARCEKTSQLLVRMLGDPSADVRQGAVHALEKLSDVGDEAATQGLTQILVHCEEKSRIKQHALLRYSVSLLY